MGAEDDVHTLRTIAEGVAAAIGTTILANGGTLDPRPDSPYAREVTEQGPFVGRSKTPVQDAYSVALLRHVCAMQHFVDLGRVLVDPPSTFGSATLTRAALENSAWAWWGFDPSLDVKGRVVRGLSAAIASLNELLRFPSVELQQQVRPKLDSIAADAEAHDLYVHRASDGLPRWVEEKPPSTTRLLEIQLGHFGTGAYRDLSALAHGVVFGVVGRMEKVGIPDLEPESGSTLMKPGASLGRLTPWIAVALDAFFRATDRRFALYGYVVKEWTTWKLETMLQLLPILRR